MARLKSVALFANCSNRELQRIARAAESLTITEGKTLMEQGEVGREAFVIVSGNAVVRRNGRKLAELGAGEVVGELSLLDHGPRTASVIAT